MMGAGARRPAIEPFVVAAAAALAYVNSLGNGFALDDVPLVRDDPRIRSLSNLPGLLLEPYWNEEGPASGLYRPLATVSFALNRAVLGAGPAGFHVVNVLAHATVSALLWAAARAAGAGRLASLLAGLLFALHPVHTEAVANVAGRAELLAAAGALGAFLLHARARREEAGPRRWLAGAAAAALYLGGLLSKETAILAPLLFALDDALARPRARGRRAGGAPGAAYLGYLLALGVGLFLRSRALGGLRGAETAVFLDNPAAFEGTGTRISTALWVLARYAGLMLWPARLCSDYSYDAVPSVRSPADPRLWAGVAVLLLLLAASGAARRAGRPVAIGAASFLVFLLPASNLLFPAGVLMAERLAYLPSAGVCLAAGHAFSLLAGEGSRRRPSPLRRGGAIVLAAAVLAALGARAMARNPVWRDNATLALNDVEIMPRSAKLQAGAGIAFHERGRLDEAEARYREAIGIYPDYAQIHYNLGVLLLDRGRALEAAAELARAAGLAPSNERPQQLLLRLLSKSEPGQAAAICRAVLAEPRLPPRLREAAERRLAAARTLPEGEPP